MRNPRILTWLGRELLAPNGKNLIVGRPSIVFFNNNGSHVLPTPNKGTVSPMDAQGYRYLWTYDDPDWSGAFEGISADYDEWIIQGFYFTEYVENTSRLFTGCTWLQQCTPGSYTFGNAGNLHNVTNAESMFEGCNNLTVDSSFGLFSKKLDNCALMYKDCSDMVPTLAHSIYTQLSSLNPSIHHDCFKNCGGDLQFIPASWGGTGNG